MPLADLPLECYTESGSRAVVLIRGVAWWEPWWSSLLFVTVVVLCVGAVWKLGSFIWRV
jgi:hypothetical protein